MQLADYSLHYYKYSHAGWETIQSKVISETAVSLSVNGETWLSFMCTPTHLEALAIGFLYNEGIIQSQAELASVQVCASGENVDVWLNHAAQKPTQWQRTSGCNGGITRADSRPLVEVQPRVGPISPDVLLAAMDQLLQAQAVYREARGIHCSALSDGQQVFLEAEDIGRHNTIDKIAGMLFLKPVDVSPKIILTTGRISSEMLMKSSRLEVDVVLSRTSPTTRSIELADLLGITLVGYARRTQLFVYTHPERLMSGEALRALHPLGVEAC